MTRSRPLSTARAEYSPSRGSPIHPPPPPPLPPPPRDGIPSASPSPRGNVPPPPPLRTNFPSAPSGSVIPTPVSTSSLSSPFSQINSTACVPSAGSASRNLSSMAARLAGGYSVPYDPREWVGDARRASMIEQDAGNATHVEEGLSSPPPPYSPPPRSREVAACTSAGSTMSPADSTFTAGNPSQTNTPASTIGIISPLNQGTSQFAESTRTNAGISTASTQYFPAPPARPPDADRRSSLLVIATRGHDSTSSSSRTMGGRPTSLSGLSMVLNGPPFGYGYGPVLTNPPSAETVDSAPAARRAVSAGGLSSYSSSQSRSGPASRSSSRQRRWQPGMPLPGPPPGPPPSSSRSQSANAIRSAHSASYPAAAGARAQPHRVPLPVPLLSPLPPTPADWSEERPVRTTPRPTISLHIQTTDLQRPHGPESTVSYTDGEDILSVESSSMTPAGLTRSAALRDPSAKGLHERRKLRRSVQERHLAELSALSVNTNPWADAMTSSASARSPSHSPVAIFERPRSSGHQSAFTLSENLDDEPETEAAEDSQKGKQVWEEDRVIARSPVEAENLRPRLSVRRSSSRQPNGNEDVPPKALPTPPLSMKNPMSAHSVLPSAASSVFDVGPTESDEFIEQSARRHRRFLLQERSAANDGERLKIFADYVVKESELRRHRYAAAFADGTFDVELVRQRLFDGTSALGTAQDHGDPDQRDGREASMDPEMRSRPETMWWKDYKPALSPIASLSNDEKSSRGRTASRWWESQTGSLSDGGDRQMKRSKRESKYMGLSAALMQSIMAEADTPSQADGPAREGENTDYPDEKANVKAFGFYSDDGTAQAASQPISHLTTPALLDISRFITLPPPYPRHFPAVNNSHPDLAAYRSTVRTLSDLGELRTRKSRHHLSVEALRNDHRQKLAEARRAFKSNVQMQVAEGNISYADAAEAEKTLLLEERHAEKDCLQAEFDMLQDVVINPSHDLLVSRITQLDASLAELEAKLVSDIHLPNPDLVQQEGDDTPELLEYLTLIKWLFETREQIHKEVFDLLTERNEKYKSIVLLPYRQANNVDKMKDTEDFFVRDSLQRRKTFGEESLSRYRWLLTVVEENVARGVELQSSAFWDIAPGILDLVQRVPDDMQQLGAISIPEAEYKENPSYRRFPQQYLYSLLDHAEKSTYQFIESQVNLHCLLHEVKGGLLAARCRLMEAQKAHDDRNGTPTGRSAIIDTVKEEEAMTVELKQHVSMIEEQWQEALGGELQGTKTRVKTMLEAVGGWEDLELEQAGG